MKVSVRNHRKENLAGVRPSTGAAVVSWIITGIILVIVLIPAAFLFFRLPVIPRIALLALLGLVLMFLVLGVIQPKMQAAMSKRWVAYDTQLADEHPAEFERYRQEVLGARSGEVVKTKQPTFSEWLVSQSVEKD